MTPDFTIKRGEVGKSIAGQFVDGDENPVDCRGNTARKFTLRRNSTNAVVINGATFTFTDEAAGRFTYRFTANDLTAMQPTPRGDDWFNAEFTVALPLETMKSPTDPLRPFLIIKFEDDLST